MPVLALSISCIRRDSRDTVFVMCLRYVARAPLNLHQCCLCYPGVQSVIGLFVPFEPA